MGDLLFMSITSSYIQRLRPSGITIAGGQFQWDICLWGFNQDIKDFKKSPLYAPWTQVLIKVWKDGSPKAQLQPTWRGPYPVILSIPTAVKVP